MDPREELTALRRMAELEAKASGASVPVVAPQVVTAPDTRPAWDKASTGILLPDYLPLAYLQVQFHL